MFKGICIGIYILSGSVLISCSSSKKSVTREKVSSGDSLKDRFAGGYTYGKKGGVAKSQSDKESDYSGKSFSSSNDFNGKEYRSDTYATDRWGGNSSFNSKKYKGGSDVDFIKKSPAFAQHQANIKEGSWNDSNYQTSGFNSASAQERGRGTIDNSVSNHADRSKVVDKVILPWKSKNAMSINETKSIMGNSNN